MRFGGGRNVLKLNGNSNDKQTPLSIQLLFDNSDLDLIRTLLLLFSFNLIGRKKYHKLQEVVFYYSLINFDLITILNEKKVNEHLLSINQYYRFQFNVNQIVLQLCKLDFIEVKGDLGTKTLDISVRLSEKGGAFANELQSDYFKALIDNYSTIISNVKYSSENLKKLREGISFDNKTK